MICRSCHCIKVHHIWAKRGSYSGAVSNQKTNKSCNMKNSKKIQHIEFGFKLFEEESRRSEREDLQASFHVFFNSSSHGRRLRRNLRIRDSWRMSTPNILWTWVGVKMCFRPSNLLGVNFPLAIMIYLSCEEAISDAPIISAQVFYSDIWFKSRLQKEEWHCSEQGSW